MGFSGRSAVDPDLRLRPLPEGIDQPLGLALEDLGLNLAADLGLQLLVVRFGPLVGPLDHLQDVVTGLRLLDGYLPRLQGQDGRLQFLREDLARLLTDPGPIAE